MPAGQTVTNTDVLSVGKGEATSLLFYCAMCPIHKAVCVL